MACGNNHISRGYLASPPTRTADVCSALLAPAPTAPRTARQELGDRGEALVAGLLSELGHEVVYQHTPGEPLQGVDIVTLAPDGRLVVTEVKSTAAANYRAPHTTQNVGNHQLDVDWTAENLTATGVVDAGASAIGDAPDQVSRQLVQFDEVSGTISVWDVDAQGHRAEKSPSEIYATDSLG